MEKKIKDYLHFYIGCKIKANRSISGEWSLLTVSHLHDSSHFKLLIRPLSDMTEEEKNEYLLTGTDSMTRFEHNAIRTQYLLLKGFDLFGSIDAGLAIDKTKLDA